MGEVNNVSLLEPDTFISVDERGADRRDTLRKYGYSLHGKPVRSQKLTFRGERLSTLGVMSTRGVLDSEIPTSQGFFEGDMFMESQFRSPSWTPFPDHLRLLIILHCIVDLHCYYRSVPLIRPLRKYAPPLFTAKVLA